MADDNPDPCAISNLWKRRGVVRASTTRLGNRLKEFEGIADHPATPDNVRQLAAKLEALDSDFKIHHFQLIDLINTDDKETLESKKHLINMMTSPPLQSAFSDCSPSSQPCPLLPVTVNCSYASLHALGEASQPLMMRLQLLPEHHEDFSLIQQYQEQLSDYKTLPVSTKIYWF